MNWIICARPHSRPGHIVEIRLKPAVAHPGLIG
jgi:hypothetical protein